MPNNENTYCIKLEFASFLRGLSGFRITDSALPGYVHVAIKQACDGDAATFFSRPCSRFTRYGDLLLIHQLFRELEKDRVDRQELIRIGSIFKQYIMLLKQIDVDHGYYLVTPGLFAGIFLALWLALLCFPTKSAFTYTGLVVSFYGLGFWMFAVWLLSKNEQSLERLKDKLIRKINFLQSLSFSELPSLSDYFPYFDSSSSVLPSYSEALLADVENASVMRVTTPEINILSNTTLFFHCNENAQNNRERGTSVQQRRYSV